MPARRRDGDPAWLTRDRRGRVYFMPTRRQRFSVFPRALVAAIPLSLLIVGSQRLLGMIEFLVSDLVSWVLVLWAAEFVSALMPRAAFRVDDHGIRFPGAFGHSVPWSQIEAVRVADEDGTSKVDLVGSDHQPEAPWTSDGHPDPHFDAKFAWLRALHTERAELAGA